MEVDPSVILVQLVWLPYRGQAGLACLSVVKQATRLGVPAAEKLWCSAVGRRHQDIASSRLHAHVAAGFKPMVVHRS